MSQLYPFVAAEVAESVRTHSVTPYPLPPLRVTSWGADVCAVGAAMTLHRSLLSLDRRLVYGQSVDAAGAG